MGPGGALALEEVLSVVFCRILMTRVLPNRDGPEAERGPLLHWSSNGGHSDLHFG